MKKARYSWWLRHSQIVLGWAAALCGPLAVVAMVAGYEVLGHILFYGIGVCLLLMWVNYACNRKMRRYMDKICQKPVTQDAEPAKVARALMWGHPPKDHYAHLPEHIRRKSLFGGNRH
ncbi:MAG: hypothetical protein II349_05895 [Akkermansia sp.]|nr:hypothetical protein [Akkermansia sp.]